MADHMPVVISSEARAGRAVWVDGIKGVAIFLVVLHHSYLGLARVGVTLPGWHTADLILGNVRMPVFFMASGLFAAKALRGPAGPFRREKIGRFAYLYLLWSVLYVAFYGAIAVVFGDPVLPELAARAVEYGTLQSPMWFVVALLLFFLAARLTRTVPAAAQIVAAGVVAVAAVVFIPVWGPARMLPYYVWFLIGCYASAAIRAGADRLGLEPVMLAIPPLTWLGRNTLPVYLLHSAVISGCINLVALDAYRPLGSAAPLVVAVAATGLSLAAWWATRRVPGLYDLPGPRKPGRSGRLNQLHADQGGVADHGVQHVGAEAADR